MIRFGFISGSSDLGSSCSGECGTVNVGTCFCDTACVNLGDCCDDYCDECADVNPVGCGAGEWKLLNSFCVKDSM